MGRGMLTERVLEVAKKQLKVEDFTVRELRLMPYVQHCVMNQLNLLPDRINQDERDILSKWRENGWLIGGASDLSVTKQFWNAMHEILWEAYADYE